ncbi:MAG TPA: ABC-2 family transporter protein, partial [Verrucomicrobiae bacterium]|nr:ABC-2 family transporter protein [Verrucomicrobiae bacterium]
KTVYGGAVGQLSNAYTLPQMISYYLLVAVVDVLTAVNEDDWQIAADIREGNINHFLLKPMDYLRYRLCLFFAGRIAFMAMAILPLIVFIFCLRHNFVAPADLTALIAFAISLVLTALLQFFMSFAMAMLAFWMLEISTVIFIVFALEYAASGHMFPLDILPHRLEQLLFLTPFPYQLYFPISVYMGKTTGPDLVQGMLIQLGWVVAMYGLARLMWARGIRKYSAFGG